MYQRMGQAAYKANLDNTLKLAAHLHHPEASFKSIHVAGTNGKGSVSHMLASVLQEAGYKVGLYTSPHLKDFRERIKINGIPIPKRRVTSFVEEHKAFFESEELSFFEMTVGLAFDYFRKERVDIAVIEVGMGGRLDSTNIIHPELSIITNIGFDHTQFLGTTYEEIAAEKAGIMKPGVAVVVGETVPETKAVFAKMASERGAPLYFAEDFKANTYESDLKGNYQKQNLQTVAVALTVFREGGWNLSEKEIRSGLKRVVENTGLLGRWQLLRENPKVICDTAHNKEGLQIVMDQLKLESYDTLHMVVGMVSDKDYRGVLPLFPIKAHYYFCAPDLPRAMAADLLMERASEFGLMGEVYPSVKRAYKAALGKANRSDLIYVGGSTFVVAEVL